METGSYDPASATDRRALASTLLAKLEGSGFSRVPAQRAGEEAVFKLQHRGRPEFEVRLYTSVVEGQRGPEARREGKDAIRAVLIYTTKKGGTRGIGKETRVNRTGDIDGICDRALERLRAVYGKAATAERCHCGAPKFLSSNDNLVCAELCWKK